MWPTQAQPRLSPGLVALATRMNITPAQHAAYTKALISEIGGDLAKVTTLYASADRSRRATAQDIAMTSKQEWKCSLFASLHWD